MAAARRVNEILAAREKRSASQHRFRGPEMPRGPAVLRLRTRARVRVSKGVYQAARYERPFSNRTRVASRRRRRSSSGTVYIANSSAKFSRASRRRRHLRRLNYMPSSPPPLLRLLPDCPATLFRQSDRSRVLLLPEGSAIWLLLPASPIRSPDHRLILSDRSPDPLPVNCAAAEFRRENSTHGLATGKWNSARRPTDLPRFEVPLEE